MRSSLAGYGMVLADTFSAPALAELLAKRCPTQSFRRIPLQVKQALVAVQDALTMAGWTSWDTCGLVLGTSFGCATMGMDCLDSILRDGPKHASPTAFSLSVTNICAGLLSQLLDIRGPLLTVSQVNLSFAGALTACQALLAGGRVKRVLLGAVDEWDPRLTLCCGQEEPQTGAIFWCVNTQPPALAEVDVLWTKTEHETSGAWERIAPLDQALRVTQILARADGISHREETTTEAFGVRATLVLRRTPCQSS